MTYSTPGEPGWDDELLPLRYPDSRPPRRRRRRGGGRFFLVLVLAVAVGAGGVYLARHRSRTENPAGFHTTAASVPGSARQITAGFLRDWAVGDYAEAAALTDDPGAAQAALAAYASDLHLRKLSTAVAGVTAVPPAGGSGQKTGVGSATTLEAVSYQIHATVAYGAASGIWSYRSALTAYQVPNGTGWYIAWDPGILDQDVGPGQHLAVSGQYASSATVTDSAGNPLPATYNDPALNALSRLLSGRPSAVSPGTPGLTVQVEDSSGQAVVGTRTPLSAPVPGRITTTISQRAERAASNAVTGTPDSAMVVIQPSTGHILAVANGDTSEDLALTGAVAPGSTMKIITATALIDGGQVTVSAPVACPKTYTAQGVTFRNDKNESEPASTPFAIDFAQSCNNAFAQWWQQLGGSLAQTARTYYGLDQPWNIGVPGQAATYFNAPAGASGAELAEEAFGEGQLTASPLAMASVAATVDAGEFRQPVVVAGTPAVSAQPLPPGTDTQLKQMMRDVVTQGTAAGLGLGPDVYAKTGTADVQGQQQPNSWMVAFDPARDVAVAGLVLNAGYGAQAAGPEIVKFLNSY